MKNGWIKLKRELLYDEIMEKDGDYLKAYIYLLLSVKAGEALISVREMSRELNIKRGKMTSIFEFLKRADKIKANKNGKQTLVVINDIDNFGCGIEPKKEPIKSQLRANYEEKQDEKEKRSKREKEEIKELYKKEEIPPISPKKEELFERFWEFYPKKIGKGYARRCFLKIDVDNALLDRMIKTVEWQKRSDGWQRENGKYIPNPSTWLNQERWADEEYYMGNEINEGWGECL